LTVCELLQSRESTLYTGNMQLDSHV